MADYYPIPRLAVESTVIKSVGYDPDSKALVVEFPKGDVWRYADVPAALYDALITAPSKGTFFGRAVRGKFSAVKVEDPPAIGECSKCGDTGVVGQTCEDCGCEVYSAVEPNPEPF